MGKWSDLIGSSQGFFKLGVGGVRLKNSSGALHIRNTTDDAFAALAAADCSLSALSFSNSATGGLVGTTTNDSPPAGYVGEYIFSNILHTSAIALVSSITKNVTSITLTAGDWDVFGRCGFTGNSATLVSFAYASITSTSNGLDDFDGRLSGACLVPNSLMYLNCIPCVRSNVRLASTTVFYLTATLGFTVNTAGAFGVIQARRVR
jgi:hypothetical protein